MGGRESGGVGGRESGGVGGGNCGISAMSAL